MSNKQIEAKETRERERDRRAAEKLAHKQGQHVLQHSEIMVMNALRHTAHKAGCYKVENRVRWRQRGQSPMKVAA